MGVTDSSNRINSTRTIDVSETYLKCLSDLPPEEILEVGLINSEKIVQLKIANTRSIVKKFSKVVGN